MINPNFQQNLGLQHQQTQEQSQHHLQAIRGAETLSRMTSFGVNESPDQAEQFPELYDELTNWLISRGRLILGVLGPNVAGKGTLIGQLMKGLESDPRLGERFGHNFKILRFPFSLSDDAAQALPSDHKFHVSPAKNPSTYTFEDTLNISAHQWAMFERAALPRFDDSNAGTVAIFEGSVPISRPITNTYPVVVDGEQDLGSSTIYNALVNPLTAADSFGLFMLGETVQRVKKGGTEFRRQLEQGNVIDALTNRRERVVMTIFRNQQPQEVDVKNLPPEIIKAVANFMLLTQAPSGAVEKLSEQYLQLLCRLNQSGEIASPTSLSYYQRIAETLGAESRVRIVKNSFKPSLTETTLNLDYFLQEECIPVKETPELVPRVLREYIYADQK